MTKDEFLALAGSRYDDLQRLNTEQTHFYDDEKGFAELWTELGRAVLEGNLGELPESPRKIKYGQSRFGRIAIADDHAFQAKTHGFFISPYLQDLMARAGVSDVYSESNDLLQMFLGIEVATTPVFRVTNALGEALEDPQEQAIQHEEWPEGEGVYASMDGSMILTQAGWKEVKLGRIFPGSAGEAVGKKQRNRMVESLYSACLGSGHEFLPRFGASLDPWADPPEQVVFITDGAEWIRNDIQDRFPQATHILDDFHAVEKLAEFAKMRFPDETRRQRWMEGQEAELYAGNVAHGLETLGKLVPLTQTAREARERRPMGQQAPLNRGLTGRRLLFPRQDRGHGHGGLAVMRRQRHHLPVQRLPHEPGRAVRGGRQGEFHLPQRGALRQPIPQFRARGGLAVVLGPDQPVRRRAAPGGDIDQRPEIAFPIRHVHQPGVGHGFGQIGDDLVAFHPAGAFLEVGRVFRLPGPHPGVEHPQRHPRRRHRQSRMHVHPMLGLVAQPSQPGDPWLRGKIQFGRILNAQHHRLARHPLHRPRGMDLQNLPPLDRWVVQQPVGGFGFRPAPAGQRDAPGRLRRQIVHQLDQALGPPCIPQLQALKLLRCPTHATTPQGYENLYHTIS